MEIIQLIILIFALFAYSRVLLRTKDKSISSSEFVFWSVVWIGVMVIALIPGITGNLAGLLGIGRGIDLMVYLSIIALFYLIFRMYVKVDKLEKNITRLVRSIALKK